MIDCAEADVLAAAHSVGSLDEGDTTALQEHLSSCADCRRLAAEYMTAASRLPLALEPVQPSPELRTRLMKAVYAEAAAAEAGAPGTASPATSAAVRVRPTDQLARSAGSWWQRLWVRVPAGRGFTAFAGVAAAALIALTSWTAATRQGTPAVTSSQPVAVAIRASALAPQAKGELLVDRATQQAVLTVTGLPGPSHVSGGASVYEVWLLPASGPPVPGAFLTQAPDGTWDALIRANVSTYASVATTVEPVGGSSVPTGPEILQAPISHA